MLLLTAGLLFALFLASYFIFDKDVFAPPTLVSLVLLFGAFCTLYNEKRWALEFSAETMETVVSGVGVFLLGGLLALLLYSLWHPGSGGLSRSVSPVGAIVIEKYKLWLVVAFELMTLFLLYRQLRAFVGTNVPLQKVVSEYRKQITLDPEDVAMRFPFLLRQCLSVCFSFAFFFVYVLGNNMAAKQKGLLLYALPVGLYLLMSFLQGYRGDMMRIWVSWLVSFYTVKKRAVGWRRTRETKKLMRTFALTVLIIGVLFVLLRTFVGRTGKATEWDPLYYVTFYAGSPLAALDLFIKRPGSRSSVWAKETFYYLNKSLGAWLNKPELQFAFPKEFRRSPNGTVIGNVYTALRAPYKDFGFVGMLIFLFIVGIFFTWLYCRVRRKHANRPVDFFLLVYSYVVYTCFMFFYNNYYFFVATSFIKTLLIWAVSRWFFTELHIRWTGFSSRTCVMQTPDLET